MHCLKRKCESRVKFTAVNWLKIPLREITTHVVAMDVQLWMYSASLGNWNPKETSFHSLSWYVLADFPLIFTYNNKCFTINTCPKYTESCKKTTKLLKLWPHTTIAVHKLQPYESIISATVIFSQLMVVEFTPHRYFFECIHEHTKLIMEHKNSIYTWRYTDFMIRSWSLLHWTARIMCSVLYRYT
jgi:hypothetical protein